MWGWSEGSPASSWQPTQARALRASPLKHQTVYIWGKDLILTEYCLVINGVLQDTCDPQQCPDHGEGKSPEKDLRPGHSWTLREDDESCEEDEAERLPVLLVSVTQHSPGGGVVVSLLQVQAQSVQGLAWIICTSWISQSIQMAGTSQVCYQLSDQWHRIRRSPRRCEGWQDACYSVLFWWLSSVTCLSGLARHLQLHLLELRKTIKLVLQDTQIAIHQNPRGLDKIKTMQFSIFLWLTGIAKITFQIGHTSTWEVSCTKYFPYELIHWNVIPIPQVNQSLESKASW